MDPIRDLEALGRRRGYTTENGKFRNVSLGDGQEEKAMSQLREAHKRGYWLILQVCFVLGGGLLLGVACSGVFDLWLIDHRALASGRHY